VIGTAALLAQLVKNIIWDRPALQEQASLSEAKISPPAQLVYAAMANF
jgi:hypothetical protein